MRRLVAAANAKPAVAARASEQTSVPTRALALAASLLLAAVAAWYFAAGRGLRQPAATTASRPQPGIVAPVPRTFAVTLSPVAVRGEASTPPVVVPASADLVALTLVIDGAPPSAPLEVVIAVVGGGETWRGPAVVDPARPGGVRADVPAARLPPHDYIVALTTRADAGAAREAGRYFLPVRGG